MVFRFLTMAMAGAAVAALPSHGRSEHHQQLYDHLELSRASCPDGHAGVIIVMHEKGSLEPGAMMLHLQTKGRRADKFGHVFDRPHSIRGISAHLSQETLEELMRDGTKHGVEAVHADCLRHQKLPKPTPVPKGLATLDAMSNVGASTTSYALDGKQSTVQNWGLAQGSRIVSGSDSAMSYEYGQATGKGTVAVLIDTGAQMSHREFQRLDRQGNPTGENRFISGKSMGCTSLDDPDQKDACSSLWVFGGDIEDAALNRRNEEPSDALAKAKAKATGRAVNTTASFTSPGHGCDAHGTHTASIMAGNTYGVAKEAEISVYQALSCVATAQDSMVVNALQETVDECRARTPYKPCVVLLSLGGEKDGLLNEAVKRTTKHGINVVVAAGNSHTDSCTTTPSSVVDATVVAAIDERNNFAEFSSYGRCVDIAAPGVGIEAAYAVVGSTDGAARLSGTSMAAPFVAGMQLQALQHFPHMSVPQTQALLKCTATKGQIHGDYTAMQSGTPNLRVHFGSFLANTASMKAAVTEAESVAKASMPALDSLTDESTPDTGGLFALSTESHTGDSFTSKCHQLIDLLDKTRPPGGILQHSPDHSHLDVAADESTINEDFPPGDDTPYTAKKTSLEGMRKAEAAALTVLAHAAKHHAAAHQALKAEAVRKGDKASGAMLPSL